ncbi:protein kinase [Nocardia sp. NPDC059246]|uniref:protein kinase domain-containing protein n=1 Tax=unclassified Nocardia TaxID=2637762 RepID=UPI003683162A
MDRDGEGTRRDPSFGIAAELAAAGFDDAEEIGRGGFGVVYRCVEPSLERAVAVKLLSAEESRQERQRFLREQRALGRFSGHPHIVQVLQADITATGRPFLVMPFHARGSLLARIGATGPMPWQEVLSVGVKMAGALAAAHANGVVHRDVNPANILLTDYGEPQLSDFGIARIGGAFRTDSGLVAGTPAFTAPEILRGEEPTTSADIYGLGATLFCLLTGHAAYERQQGESVVAQFVRIAAGPVPDLRGNGVPALMCAAVESAMATDVGERPATVREFGEQLRNVQFACGLQVDSMVLPSGDENLAGGSARRPLPTARSGPTPTPTPTTRYRPPSPTRQPVARRRLLEVLRAERARRLVLIHGPAGFGKSTLAAQWADRIASEGVRVGWLSVDLDDNNVVWFLSHLIRAIHHANPDVATGLAQILEEHSSGATQYVLTALIDETHAGAETLALVIDDWHRVTNPETIAALEFLLERGCHHLQMIVTSRSRTGLPLGRMRVRDELIEIDETGLRFDSEETAAFLTETNGLNLATADIEHLRKSTEGWAAALQLASLSLRGRDNPAAYIGQISGRHFAIGEYLMENVIGALEPGILEFVMRTSVPEQICSELAEALTDVDSGQEMLEEVHRRDLFLRSVDDDLRWFRYHGLFADFLRRRLVDKHPRMLERLHLTASEWFASHDMTAEAVDHALAAGDPDRAVRLVAERAEELMECSRNATFLGLVDKLPSSLTALDPKLQVYIAWANIGPQRPAAAIAALDLADRALAAGDMDDDERTRTQLEASLARTAVSLVVDRPVTVPEPVLARIEAPVRPFLAQATAVTASVSALYRFDFSEVARWHRWIEPYRTRTHGPFAITYCDCVAGLAAYEQLDIAAAESHYRTALELALQSGVRSHATRLAGALLGELLYEKGQFVEAEQLLDAGLSPEGGAVEFLLATYGTGARLAAVRGDMEALHRRLNEGDRIAENLSLPRLAARMVNERVRLGLGISDTDRESLEHIAPYTVQPNALRAVTAELAHDSAIRLLLAEHPTPEAVDLACRRSERLVSEISRQNRPRALLQAQLLHGCCLSARGRTADTAELLAPVLARCADAGLVRLVVDSGCRLQPIVESLYGSSGSESRPPRSFLRQLLAEYAQVLPDRSRRSGNEASP